MYWTRGPGRGTLSRVPSNSAEPTPTQVLDETASWLAGLGIVVMALFPLAVPLVVLTAAVAIAAGVVALALGLLASPVVAAILLLRRLGRRGTEDAERTFRRCGSW
jgi:hypothetical protein